MCAALYGLLWPTYANFAATHADGDSQISIANASQALNDVDIPLVTSVGSCLGWQVLGAADKHTIPQRAQNARRRAKGLEFSLHKPMGILWLTRGVMEPWRRLVARHFGSSGSSIDRQEQSEEAQSILRGTYAPRRSYRPLNLADKVYYGITSQTHSRTTRLVAWLSGC